MKRHLSVFIRFLVLGGLLSLMVAGSAVYAQDQGRNVSGTSGILGDDNGLIQTFLAFLKEVGIDLSYGEDGGTIFSMVDESLTRIVTDLSSGKSEGFLDIPLINETLVYLNINPGDIVMDPEKVEGTMPALKSYESQYGNKSGSIR
ncbi:MAG TPA: hypothetical protein VN429_00125 [Methanospirillum sp.]|uniref:hypothetical protein n=1 Tax=Methanospirillum sp. TaxID=45200 RepID=UPI002B993350|nr:hypothetical protein [Methanospirillum sp.]HWQ62790.1 hypothetical protein [Methanospirillum sp.]